MNNSPEQFELTSVYSRSEENSRIVKALALYDRTVKDYKRGGNYYGITPQELSRVRNYLINNGFTDI